MDAERKELTKLIDDFVNPVKQTLIHNEALTTIFLKLKNNDIKLQEVIKVLGDYLTSKDALIRSRGILLISEIVNNTELSQLSISEAATISQFFAARLLDNVSRREVIKGVFGLLKNHQIEDDASLINNNDVKNSNIEGNESPVEFLVRSIFNELHIPSLPFQQRKDTCEILSLLLEKYRFRINRNMGRDFVVGIIQAVDQEKDPRNLRTCFKLIQEVIQSIAIHNEFQEEIFEVVSCYFPIDIKNTTSKENNEEVAEELNQMILDTITLNNNFMEFAVPYLLEQISDSPNDKKVFFFESFYYCIEKYFDPSRLDTEKKRLNAIKQLENVWGLFRTEILYSKDEEVIDAAKGTLKALTQLLSRLESSKSIIEEFLKPIITDCTHQIASPSSLNNNDSKLVKQCTSLLSAIGGSTSIACELITKSSLSMLIQLYYSDDTPQHRLQSNRSIVSFLLSSYDCFMSEKSAAPYLLEYKEQLYLLFTENLQNSQSSALLKASSVLGIQYLIILSSVTPNLLSIDEIKVCVEILSNLIAKVSADPDQSPQRRSLNALILIGNYYIDLICEITLPKLINSINESLSSDEFSVQKGDDDDDGWASEEEEIQRDFLQSFSSFAVYSKSFDIILPQLLNWIQSLSQKETTFKLLQKFLSELKLIIEKSKLPPNQSLPIYPSLLSILLTNYFINSVHNDADHSIFTLFSDILALLIHRADQNDQEVILEKMLNLYLRQKNDFNLQLNDDQIHNFTPFKETINCDFENFKTLLRMIINTCQLIVLQKSVNDLHFLVKNAINQLSVETNKERIDSISEFIAILCNKFDRSFLQTELLAVIDHFASSLHNNLQNINDSNVQLLAWITKALCSKNDAQGWKLVELFSNLLNSAEQSQHFITIIEKVLHDSKSFNKNYFVTIKPLFAQKFFSITKSQVMKSFKENNQSGTHLLAMSSLLKNLSPDLLQLEIPSIFPILRQSLSSNNIEVISSSLSSIALLIDSSPNIIESHIDSIISILLQLITFKGSIIIRKKSIECLSSILKLPHFIVFRFRDEVINKLKDALDDPKRDVRIAASACRNKWYTKKD